MSAYLEAKKKAFHKNLAGILIVDQNPSSRSQLKDHFQNFQCHVSLANSLLEALHILGKERISVVIISLPQPHPQLYSFFQDMLVDHPSVDGLILGTQLELNQLEQLPFRNIANYINKGVAYFHLLDQLIKLSLDKREYINQVKQKNKNLKWQLEQEKQKNQKLEEENHNKSEFLLQLSNNLILPLTHLIQFADIGLDRVKRKELSLAGDYLAEIKLITHELTIYINDLLEITQLSSGESQFDIEEVDVKDFFKRVKNRFQAIADNAKISFSIHIQMKTPYIFADYNRLLKVIHILMRNAFRYVPEKGKIDIRVSQEDHHCLIQIKDNGPGIPLNKRINLFNMYSQNRVQNPTGIMGFGLSICKELLVRQNGDIWLDDNQEGCCFFITLPIADSLFD